MVSYIQVYKERAELLRIIVDLDQEDQENIVRHIYSQPWLGEVCCIKHVVVGLAC